MAEEVAFYYNKLAFNYGTGSIEIPLKDSFDFAAPSDGAVADYDHDKWIDVLAIDWGVSTPGASAYEYDLKGVMVTSYDTRDAADGGDTQGGLRSDGDLAQSVSDADMGGDFIL